MSVERIALRQQRDLGQIVEDAFSIYSENFWPFFRITAVLIPFGILIGILIQLRPAIDNGIVFLQVAAQWLPSLAIVAAVADLDAGRAPELSHARRQRPPDFFRAYQAVFTRFWTLLGASLRAALHLILSFIPIIGIPWAIQGLLRSLFIYQAVILDGTSARAALSYSADAVQGRWWRTLGISIIIVIVGVLPLFFIGGLFGLAPALISVTARAVVTAAILPFGAIAMTLLYLDLKIRRETDVSA